MTTANFYRDLAVLESFAEAIETNRHTEVPGDWWVVIADVIGSTKAIEAGAYKKVNTVGVACIAAVVNVDRSIEMPFVFGGDGATFAVPDTLRERVIPALREAQRLSREQFDLLLRVGLVRVSDLLDGGLSVRLAKIRLSPNITQPTSREVAGKKRSESSRTRSPMACFECRKTRVFARAASRGSNVAGRVCRAFMITNLRCWWLPVSGDADVNLATYRKVSDKIAQIYGTFPATTRCALNACGCLSIRAS
jgi:hypothetical protein